MKNIYLFSLIAIISFGNVSAQEVKKQLEEAQSSYSEGNLQDARFALQQTLNEIDRAIGAEILRLLPSQLDKMAAIETDDNITATSLGFAGLFVSRNYGDQEYPNASVQIISDSPLMAGISAILALPMIGNDPNQKRIRVGSYRALLQKSQNSSGMVTWEAQVPIGSTLLTFSCNGIDDEKKITELLNTLPIEQIARLAQ
jgi:hypothetical protein